MTRILSVARRVLLQLKGDRRTLALMLVAPLLILTLLWLIFDSDPYSPKVAAVGLHERWVAALGKAGARVRTLDREAAEQALRRREVDAVLEIRNLRPHIRMEGSDPARSLAVGRAILQAGRHLLPFRPPEPVIEFLHGSADMDPFDNFGPVLLGFLVFFFTFLVSGISVVRERQTGTLERMLSTPVRRHEVVLGYVLGFAAVVVLQSTLMTVHSLFVLDMMLAGSFVWLLVIVLLLAATALCLGMFLSAFARTEFQMLQFIPLVIVPQVFFSGIFPLETMPKWLATVGRAFPLTYAADAMREVMIRGGGWREIRGDLLVLAGLAALLVLANVRALKRYRPL